MNRTSEKLKISIVTVVLNSEDLIVKTLDSVTKQIYPNIEYIILDGGSTDGTIAIITKYINKIHKLIIEPDHGIYDAMNKSLKLATGDYLIFMNAGDRFFSENTIADFVLKINSNDSIYYGDAIYTDRISGNSVKRGGSFSKYRLSKTNICHQTIFYPKKVYKSHYYIIGYKMFADWAYNIQLFSNYHYAYINQTIAYYDSNGLSASTSDNNFKRDQKKLILKHLGLDAIVYLIFNKIVNVIFSHTN